MRDREKREKKKWGEEGDARRSISLIVRSHCSPPTKPIGSGKAHRAKAVRFLLAAAALGQPLSVPRSRAFIIVSLRSLYVSSFAPSSHEPTLIPSRFRAAREPGSEKSSTGTICETAPNDGVRPVERGGNKRTLLCIFASREPRPLSDSAVTLQERDGLCVPVTVTSYCECCYGNLYI